MRNSRAVRALLSLGMVVGLGATGTYAYWTDEVTVTGTTISTGTIRLAVNGSRPTLSTSSMSISNMVPGNTTAAVFTVSNVGTAPLKYYLNATATNATLNSALVVKVTGAPTVTTTNGLKSCGGAALTPSGTSFAANLLGTAASQRTLTASGTGAGSSETICIEAMLKTDADSALQGTSTDVTLTFNGSQL